MAVSTNQSSKKTAQGAQEAPGERRCLVTGAFKPKAELIRFVLDPEGRVVPDLAARLPGRGLWVSATREALSLAASKNLFAKAAKTKAFVDAALPEQVAALMTRRCLDLLGLARSVGAVVAREPAVLEALAAGQLSAVLLAADAGGDIRKKMARAPLLFDGFSRAQLGGALGREHLVALGLKPHPLTTKLQDELRRWQGLGVSSYDDQQKPNGSSVNP